MARQDQGLAEFESEFRQALEQQAATELDSLAQLGEVQALFHVFLEHESQRLEGKLGAEHPRSLELKTALEDNFGRIRAVDGEREIGRIRVPEVAEGDALVHGRVKEAGGSGVPGLTVCLVDQANNALAGIDPGTTDRSGYYSIAVPLTAGRYQNQARRPQIFLAVFAAAGRLLHRGKQPLELAKGARLQIEVTLARQAVLATGKDDSRKPEKKRRETPAAAPVRKTPVRKAPGPHTAILEPLSNDRGFAEIGASVRKLENRFGSMGLDTPRAVAGLLDRADREVRDDLRLPNLKSARAFKRILAKVLKKTG